MNKKLLNQLISLMSKKQNSKKKLNAGQLREAASICLKSLNELSSENKNTLIKMTVR